MTDRLIVPEKLYFPSMLRKMWSSNEVQAWLDDKLPEFLAEHDKKKDDQQSLDILQRLLYAYGIKGKLWDEARVIVDRERPLLPSP
jgi:hypothetical protein